MQTLQEYKCPCCGGEGRASEASDREAPAFEDL